MLSRFTSRGLAFGHKLSENTAFTAPIVHQELRCRYRTLGSRKIQRLFAVEDPVTAEESRSSTWKSEETGTEPLEMKTPGTRKSGSTAQMLSKAEEALTKLVSRHQGDIKVRHRDKALRALDLAGMSPFPLAIFVDLLCSDF